MAGGRFLELSCAAASEGTERLGRTRRSGLDPQPLGQTRSPLFVLSNAGCSCGKQGRLAFAMTGKLEARRRAPENNNLPPGSLLLFFPRYISRLGGTNHRKAPARWPQRRVTGRASQWPGLDFFLARPGRSRTCARVLSAMPLAAALVFFFFFQRSQQRSKLQGSARRRHSPRHTLREPRPCCPSARVVEVGDEWG